MIFAGGSLRFFRAKQPSWQKNLARRRASISTRSRRDLARDDVSRASRVKKERRGDDLESCEGRDIVKKQGMTRAKAAEHIANIRKAKDDIRAQTRAISRHRGALARVIANAFSEESAPIDGMTITSREVSDIDIDAPCSASPVGVCAYTRWAMSLPGQRGVKEASGYDACIFCGKPGRYIPMPGRPGI